MAEYIIREFVFPDDYPQAVEIWKNSSPGVNFSRSDSPEEIQKKLKYSPDLFLVAESANSIIGTIIGGYDGRRGMIYHLAIQESHQKAGIGRALMQEIEARLKAKGCVKSYLMVTKENTPVIQYYQNLGWNLMDIFVMGKEFE
jgi:ribosomal protein S18 acetylase RimI-like enzyme